MYKYRYNNQIHSASSFSEARKQAGLTFPEGINPISHFVVRVWLWDEEEDSFDIEILDAPGHQVFDEYDDAFNCFNVMSIRYPKEIEKEIKLDMIHYHRGKITTYHSKILFPPLLAGQL